MAILHLVSHTHWDREWYKPFQVFRLQFVSLVDRLLDLLRADRNYRYFMLDGQTALLDDYCAMRPGREAEIRRLVRSGRLLIGPWHVLMDEFLVSPESIIRNLLLGERTARRFGGKMPVGYIPDQFGHIGQMPQILHGFGIDTACLWRGVGDEPCEFQWEAPDGSRVFTANLREGYMNAAWLPADEPEAFARGAGEARDALKDHAASGHLLLMQGFDHMEAVPGTSAAVRYARGRLGGDTLVHSTLPAFLAAARASLKGKNITPPSVRGELRSSRRSNLLPGAHSSRMWIKQRNFHCETLLEKWAEPLSAWDVIAGAMERPGAREDRSGIIRQAWRLLMDCHPHDSICGASIDQVHREMEIRFDQVEQIAGELVNRGLETLAARVNTLEGAHELARLSGDSSIAAPGMPSEAIIVFNPVSDTRRDLVTAPVFLPADGEIEIVDERGVVFPHIAAPAGGHDVADISLDRKGFLDVLKMAHNGRIEGMTIRDVRFERHGHELAVDARLDSSWAVDLEAFASLKKQFEAVLADESLSVFRLHARYIEPSLVTFVPGGVPGLGCKAFWTRPSCGEPPAYAERPGSSIENEFFTVTASPENGTLRVTDRRSGATYGPLNRFADGGDRGDEYNYCPPEQDTIVDSLNAARNVSVRTTVHGAVSFLDVSLSLPVPARLREDRRGRSEETAEIAISSRVTLAAGVPRIDIATTVDNTAEDHRLRVHFEAPVKTDYALHDGHFEVVRRPIGVPPHDDTWFEPPRPEVPQRLFTAVSDGRSGLMVAVKGLPEVTAIDLPGGSTGIVLTLLRCVGWLSRDDLSTRKGHAGPQHATPGAQMPGRHRFEYSIITHNGDWMAAGEEARAYAAPMRAAATGLHGGPVPAACSFMEVHPREFVISAVKVPEDGNGIVARGYNMGDGDIEVTIKPLTTFRRAMKVRLDETPVKRLKIGRDGGVRFSVRAHEIASVLFS